MDRTTEAAPQRWPLHGFWRAWFWISAAIGAGLVVVAAGMVVGAWLIPLPPAKVILLFNAAVLLAVSAVMGRQLAITVLDASLGPDGTLTLRRLGGTLHTHALRVRVVRRSAMVSGKHTQTVVETADGVALLMHPLAERDALISAIRRYHPGLTVRQ